MNRFLPLCLLLPLLLFYSPGTGVRAQNPVTYGQCGPDLTGAPGAAGQFGQTLAISGDGNVVAVAALLEGDNNAGAVRLYRRDGEDYLPVGQPITTSAPNALFGRALALNGDGSRLAFSSSLRLTTGGNSQIGFTVFVYDLNGNDYVNTATISGWPTTRQFGASLDMTNDGTRIIVGDPGEAPGGAVYVYDQDPMTNQWTLLQIISAGSASGAFGSAVAVSGDGNHLLVGAEAPGADNDLSDVQQYAISAATDSYQSVRAYEGQVGSADFGVALDIDDTGNTFMIADDGADVGVDLEGYVAVWRYRDDGSLRFFANVVTPPTTSRFGQFGSSAALSGDGTRLVVGDHNFSDPANGVGRVYLYDIPEDGRMRLLTTIATGDEAFFNTGRAVGISTDGNRVAVGSHLANANDGLARVYSPECAPVAVREAVLDLPDLKVYSDGAALRVNYGRELGAVVSTLVSSDGRVVGRRRDLGGRGYVWAVGLPRGVYFLRLRSAGGMVTRRVVW